MKASVSDKWDALAYVAFGAGLASLAWLSTVAYCKGIVLAAQLAVAFGTLALAVVAAFQYKFTEWLNRPILTSRTTRVGPDWLLTVSNEDGKGPAMDVEVIASTLCKAENGGCRAMAVPLPANLRWSAESSRERTLPILHRGSVWACRLLHFTLLSDGNGTCLDKCWLAVKAYGDGEGLEIEPGTYVLSIRLVARNHKAIISHFGFTYTNEYLPTETEARNACKLEPDMEGQQGWKGPEA